MGIKLDGYARMHREIMLGGKKWTFSELSLSDFAQFRAWVIELREKNKDKRRERLIEEAKKIGGIDPLKLLEQLDKPLTDSEVETEMETVDGMGYLAYLSLKYHYPEVTLENAMELITIEKIPEVAEVITGGMKAEGPKKKRVTPKSKS